MRPGAREVSRRALVACVAVALLLACPLVLAAQTPAAPTLPAAGGEVLHGIVIDTAGRPVVGLGMALHRVSKGGAGAMITRDTSDARGTFSLKVPGNATPGTVFFVATRYDGKLFIGQPFRLPFPENSEYIVTVGAGAATAADLVRSAVTAAPAPTPPSRAGRWFLVVLLGLIAVGALGLGAVYFARDRRLRRRRALLLEIAALDERCAEQELAADAAATYQRDRARLLVRAGATD